MGKVFCACLIVVLAFFHSPDNPMVLARETTPRRILFRVQLNKIPTKRESIERKGRGSSGIRKKTNRINLFLSSNLAGFSCSFNLNFSLPFSTKLSTSTITKSDKAAVQAPYTFNSVSLPLLNAWTSVPANNDFALSYPLMTASYSS